MLILSGQFTNKKIISMRSGQEVAYVLGPIINPNNLKIEGLKVQDSKSREELILLTQDIRQYHKSGIYINDHAELVSKEDLVRLKEIIKMNFNIVGKNVETASASKVGKVTDYAFDDSSMFIVKLFVNKPLFKSFNSGSLTVHRDQIINITPTKVIIEDLLSKVPAAAANVA
jgi:sporulation protein YlmC with PRC-barrel domain